MVETVNINEQIISPLPDRKLVWLKEINSRLINFHESEKLSDKDIERVVSLRSLLDEDLDDDAFRKKLEDLDTNLPTAFQKLEGMVQTPPREDIDPRVHTINTLKLLDTRNFDEEDRLIARTVLIFHDLGKIYDAEDKEHPRRSADIVRKYLVGMDFTPEQIVRIINQIKWHDALGEVARRDGRNILFPEDVVHYFPNIKELQLHKAIVIADVGSIPGLKKYLPEIEANYKLLEAKLKSQEDYIDIPEVDENIEDVTFEKDDDQQRAMMILSNIFESANFDNIDYTEHQRLRNSRFEDLDQDDKEFLEKYLVTIGQTDNEMVLEILRSMGKETDRAFVNMLEEKYHIKLDRLRIAVEVFNMTYIMWETSYLIRNESDLTNYEIENIRRKLIELKKSAQNLSSYRLVMTHQINSESEPLVDKSKALIKSDSEEKYHYEGDGVYLGLMGSYREWADGKIYKTRVPLSATIPIITRYNQPQMMTNVLCEVLDIDDSIDNTGIPHGLVQWYQPGYRYLSSSHQWRISLLQEMIGSEINYTKDKNDNIVLTSETDLEPIIWGSLCRALCIERFIPVSQLSKAALLPSDYYEDYTYPDPDEEELELSVRAIKGINSRERIVDV